MDSHCKLEEFEKYDMNQRIVFILFLSLNPSIIYVKYQDIFNLKCEGQCRGLFTGVFN